MVEKDNNKKGRITIKDVAELAGVTPAVVSRVFNNDETLNIKDETRKKVLKAMSDLNYKPNTVARSLRTKTVNTIGLIISDINNPFYASIIRGVQVAAEEAGYCMILCDTHDDVETEMKYIAMLKEQFVKGIILSSTFVMDSIIKELKERDIKYVMVNRMTTESDAPYIRTDDIKGEFDAVKYLIGLGHKRIAHIAGPFYADTSIKRIQGYTRALVESGLKYDNRYLIEASRFEEKEGYEACKRLLNNPEIKRPTAITTGNDLLAIGATHAIKEAGLKIPDDISLVGYNDIWICEHLNPPLTTVHSPLYEMGKKAFEVLLAMLNGEDDKVERSNIFNSEMVIRESACECREEETD